MKSEDTNEKTAYQDSINSAVWYLWMLKLSYKAIVTMCSHVHYWKFIQCLYSKQMRQCWVCLLLVTCNINITFILYISCLHINMSVMFEVFFNCLKAGNTFFFWDKNMMGLFVNYFYCSCELSYICKLHKF